MEFKIKIYKYWHHVRFVDDREKNYLPVPNYMGNKGYALFKITDYKVIDLIKN